MDSSSVDPMNVPLLNAASIALHEVNESDSTSGLAISSNRGGQKLRQRRSVPLEADYVWSASQEEDGSFVFYAVPSNSARSQSQYAGISGSYLDPSAIVSDSRDAAAQYWFYANLLTARPAHLLNVYA